MEDILIPIFICVVLPVLVVFLTTRKKIKENETKRDIMLTSLEMNPDIDTKSLLDSFKSPQKLLKEKLLSKLLCGSVCSLIGLFGCIALVIIALCGEPDPDAIISIGVIAAPCLAVGIAFMVNYFVGKKMLASEIEAEEKQKQLGQ